VGSSCRYGRTTNGDHAFFLQLVLNAAWSPVFFGLHHTRAALVIIVLPAAAIAATLLAA
jgi:tryptophan-rich sensory protein